MISKTEPYLTGLWPRALAPRHRICASKTADNAGKLEPGNSRAQKTGPEPRFKKTAEI